MKPSTLLFFLLMQLGFIAFGLAVTLWTMNEWDAGEGLNAIFGGFMGGLCFLIAWRTLRRWARRHFGFESRN